MIAPRKRAGLEFPRGTCECAAEVIIWVGVRGKPGLPPRRMVATCGAGVPRRSNSLAIHLSAMLQSGCGKRSRIRSRCNQLA